MGRTHLFAFACSVCVCLTAGSEFAWSQTASPAVNGAGNASKPGNALVLGIREYRRGEYEQAARALKTAKQGVDQLSPKDRKSLEEYLTKTEQALASRAQAAAEIEQAESLVASGDTTSAAAMLQHLTANPYLSQSDRVRVQALNEKVRGSRKRSFIGSIFSRQEEAQASTVPSTPAPTTVAATPAGPQAPENLSKADAKRLLQEGRQFLEKGFYDQAQRWATEANKYKGRWFIGDSPEKLLVDIEVARARAGAQQPKEQTIQTVAATQPQQEPKPVKTMTTEPVKPAVAATTPAKPAADMPTVSKPTEPSKVETAAAEVKSPTLPKLAPLSGTDGTTDSVGQDGDKRAQATALVKQARKAQDAGDWKKAVDLALQAQALNVEFAPNEDSPEKIFAAHEALRDRLNERKSSGQSASNNAQARKHMETAQRHLAAGEHKEAMREALKALELKPTFAKGELTPQQLMEKIRAEAKPQAPTVADSKPAAGTDPKSSVQMLVEQNKFEEARQAAKSMEMKEDAQLLLASIDEAEKATGFLEAGKNALDRGDVAQAAAFFKEASKQKDALSSEKQQQLQELLQTTLQFESAPGRARATDAPNQFVNLQETPPAGPATERDPDPLSEARQKEQIMIQQLRQEVISTLQQAQRLMQTNPEAAISLLESQRTTVQTSPLDRDLTTPMVQQLESRIRLYRVQREGFDLQRRERERLVSQQIQRQRQDTVEIEKQTMVKELMKRYQAAMDEANYQEAETVAYQITEIAPDEVAGHAALWKAHLARSYAVNEDFEHRRKQGWIQAIRLAQESAVPFPDEPPIVYIDPQEWENLTIRRAKYKSVDLSEKSKATQEIEKALERPVSFDFQETPLTDVIDFLREYTGVNIVLDQNGLDIVMVDPDTPVTLSLEQVQLRSALKLLLSQFELVALIQDEVLLITDEQETGQQLVTRVYPVADLVIPIIDFNSGGVGLGGALGGGNQGQGGLGGGGFGGFGGGGGGGGGFGGGGGGGLGGGGGGLGGGGGGGQGNLTGGGGQATGEDIAEEVIELIQSTISPDTWEENGGTGTIEYFQPNRSFVVTQTQAVHEQLKDLLTQLRRLQDLQVSVEVRFITVEETFFERIGIDFDVSFDNNNDRFIQESLNTQLQPPGLPIGVVLQNQIGLPDGNHVRGTTVGVGPTGTVTPSFNIPVAQSSFQQATVPQIGNVTNTAIGGTDFGIAFLNDIDVFLLLQAVQGDVRSNIAQAPKVTLFNGQTSSVIVADQVPFITDATPVVSAGAVTFDPTITVLSDGTTLTVQAVVSADRRYVRLQVVPVITQIQGVSVQQVSGQTGGSVTGGGNFINPGVATINIQLPTVNIVSVLTTVSVPDGGTVLLGGLKTHQEARNEYGTPILGHLPYINRLFKNAASARFTQSLLLMVTPRIIIQEEEEAKLGVQTAFGQ